MVYIPFPSSPERIKEVYICCWHAGRQVNKAGRQRLGHYILRLPGMDQISFPAPLAHHWHNGAPVPASPGQHPAVRPTVNIVVRGVKQAVFVWGTSNKNPVAENIVIRMNIN